MFVTRVSTSQIHRQGADAMIKHQAELLRIQAQMATGKRVMVASDDPLAKGKLLGLEKAIGDADAWTRNAQVVQDRVGLSENALSSVSDSLTRLRELAVQASSATYSSEDRQAIAAEMKEIYANVLAQANARDGQGRYLFAGTDDAQAPFSGGLNSGVSYLGNDTLSMLRVGSSRELASNSSGADIFMRLATGNGRLEASATAANTGTGAITGLEMIDAAAWDGDTYTINFVDAQTYEVLDSGGTVISGGTFETGNPITFRGASIEISGEPAAGDSFSVEPAQPSDVFASMERLIDAVSIGDGTAAFDAQRNTQIFEAMSAIEFAQDHIVDETASLGSRLNATDDALAMLQDRLLQFESTRSVLEDLDYTEATTEMSEKELALQAAQQSYLRIAGLSLFDYL